MLYQEIFLCNDRIGIALSKRKIKQYKKLKEQAYTILRRFQKVLDDLDDIARYTQSKDEWEYWQRVREAEDYYRKHGRFYYEEAETTKENKSDASNKKDHQERNRQSATSKPLQANADIFFGDCDNIEALEKKYRSLAKKYHPDMPTGDKDTFQKMLAEYLKNNLNIT